MRKGQKKQGDKKSLLVRVPQGQAASRNRNTKRSEQLTNVDEGRVRMLLKYQQRGRSGTLSSVEPGK